MSRKHVIKVDLMDPADVPSTSMDAAITSKITHVSELDKCSIHLKWAAGPEGAFSVFARNGDKDDFYELLFSAPIVVVPSDDEVQIVLLEMPFTDIYVVWTPSNAVASDLTARLTSKTVGA